MNETCQSPSFKHTDVVDRAVWSVAHQQAQRTDLVDEEVQMAAVPVAGQDQIAGAARRRVPHQKVAVSAQQRLGVRSPDRPVVPAVRFETAAVLTQLSFQQMAQRLRLVRLSPRKRKNKETLVQPAAADDKTKLTVGTMSDRLESAGSAAHESL